MADAVLPGRANAFVRALPAKGKAVGIHVSISLVIFFVLLYLILVEWYPLPYFHTDGGWQGIRLMFAVDVVLGPLLTFVVFNPAKSRREIVLDLSMIAAIQLAALSWGIFTVHQQRPVAIIEFDGTFESVTADAYGAQGIDLATLSQYDERQPPLIFQRVSGVDELRQSVMLINQGVARIAQSFLYERFRDRLPDVFEQAARFEQKITESQPALKREFARLRAEHGANVGFLPFAGRYGTAILVLSRNGDVVDTTAFPD